MRLPLHVTVGTATNDPQSNLTPGLTQVRWRAREYYLMKTSTLFGRVQGFLFLFFSFIRFVIYLNDYFEIIVEIL